MTNKDDYFKALQLTVDNGYTSKRDLEDVLNFEPTHNRAAIDFRNHIGQGLIDRDDAMKFVNSL